MSTKDRELDDTLSELFDALSHEYRRRILLAVAQQNAQGGGDLTSEAIVEAQNDDGDALTHITTSLTHVHLPKLANAGFIEWDRDSGSITRGPRFQDIERVLKLMHDHRDELPGDWP